MLWTLLFWVFVGWAGFAVALGGVAKLQKDVADHPGVQAVILNILPLGPTVEQASA